MQLLILTFSRLLRTSLSNYLHDEYTIELAQTYEHTWVNYYSFPSSICGTLILDDDDDVFTPELGGGIGDNEAGVTGVGEASRSRSLSRSKNTGPDLVTVDAPGTAEIEGRVGDPPYFRLSLGDRGLDPMFPALGE